MRIGFAGLGRMGRPMAANLAKAGYDLLLYDVDPDALADCARAIGQEAAAGPGALAECEMLVTMLPTGHTVRALLTEADGGAFLAAAQAGSIVIDMSSSEPEGTRNLSAILAERGVALVDAPVSGGVARAADGSLAIMAGSDAPSALERARPVLQAMGARIFETGGSGTGHAVKALNNVVAGTTFAVLSEALMAARAFGLDETTLIDVMDVSTGHSFFTQHVAKQQVISGDYATGFAVGLLAKDVKIAADMTRALGVDAPLIGLSEERWAGARDALGPATDHSRAITVWSETARKPEDA